MIPIGAILHTLRGINQNRTTAQKNPSGNIDKSLAQKSVIPSPPVSAKVLPFGQIE